MNNLSNVNNFGPAERHGSIWPNFAGQPPGKIWPNRAALRMRWEMRGSIWPNYAGQPPGKIWPNRAALRTRWEMRGSIWPNFAGQPPGKIWPNRAALRTRWEMRGSIWPNFAGQPPGKFWPNRAALRMRWEMRGSIAMRNARLDLTKFSRAASGQNLAKSGCHAQNLPGSTRGCFLPKKVPRRSRQILSFVFFDKTPWTKSAWIYAGLFLTKKSAA